MNSIQILQTVSKISSLLTDANMLMSELEGVVQRMADAEAEAIEAQGQDYMERDISPVKVPLIDETS